MHTDTAKTQRTNQTQKDNMPNKHFNLFKAMDILKNELGFVPVDPVSRHKLRFPFGRLGEIYIAGIDTSAFSLVTLTLLHDRFTIRCSPSIMEALNRRVLGATYIPHNTNGDTYDVVIKDDVTINFTDADRFKFDMEMSIDNLKRYADTIKQESARYEQELNDCIEVHGDLFVITPRSLGHAGLDSERYIQEAAKRSHQTKEQIIKRIMAGDAFEVSDANDETCIYISLRPDKQKLSYYHVNEKQDITKWIHPIEALDLYRCIHDSEWFYLDARIRADEKIELGNSCHIYGKAKK